MKRFFPLLLGILFVSLGCNLLFMATYNYRIIYVMENESSNGSPTSRTTQGHSRKLHEYELLINEPEMCVKNLTLLVVVCSATSHQQKRNAIRNTWGDHLRNKTDNRLVFLLGKTSDFFQQGMIDSESRNHRDIIQYNFVDSYRNLTVKSVAMLDWAKNFCPNVRFILKGDDDIYINVANLMRSLMDVNLLSSKFIEGYVFQGARPVRNKHSKWRTTEEEFAKNTYPDYVSGFAYVMTKQAAEDLYSSAMKIRPFWLEDVYITGICREQTNITLRHNPSMHFMKLRPNICAFKKAIAFHNVSPHWMLTIHKDMRSRSMAC